MTKKLWTVQAVPAPLFDTRPARSPFVQDQVLTIPPHRRASVLQMTKAKAISEAERLSRAHPDTVFLVMEAVHLARVQQYISQPLEN